MNCRLPKSPELPLVRRGTSLSSHVAPQRHENSSENRRSETSTASFSVVLRRSIKMVKILPATLRRPGRPVPDFLPRSRGGCPFLEHTTSWQVFPSIGLCVPESATHAPFFGLSGRNRVRLMRLGCRMPLVLSDSFLILDNLQASFLRCSPFLWIHAPQHEVTLGPRNAA